MKKEKEIRNVQSGQELRRRSRSERGIALVLVLVLSAIGLIVMTTVLYVITTGTRLSGEGKRYRTAHEAALGCVDVMRKIIQDQGAIAIPGVTISYESSFLAKLDPAASLSGFDTKVSIDPYDPATYDLTIDVGNPVYRCSAKMVQKQQGNTNKGYRQVRIKTGVVPADPGMGVKNFTYYSFTVLTQKVINPDVRSKIDLVHIF